MPSSNDGQGGGDGGGGVGGREREKERGLAASNSHYLQLTPGIFLASLNIIFKLFTVFKL